MRRALALLSIFAGAAHADADLRFRWPRVACDPTQVIVGARRPIDFQWGGAGAPTLRIKAVPPIFADWPAAIGRAPFPSSVPAGGYTWGRVFSPRGRRDKEALEELTVRCREPLTITWTGRGEPGIHYTPSEPLIAEGSLHPDAGPIATTRAFGQEIAALLSSWKDRHSSRVDRTIAIANDFAQLDAHVIVTPDMAANSDWGAKAMLGDDQLIYSCWALHPPIDEGDRPACGVRLFHGGQLVADYQVEVDDYVSSSTEFVQRLRFPEGGEVVVVHPLPQQPKQEVTGSIYGGALELDP